MDKDEVEIGRKLVGLGLATVELYSSISLVLDEEEVTMEDSEDEMDDASEDPGPEEAEYDVDPVLEVS
jgi:hypothetical protein